jgi:tetratricopeptide (TPR) repeat protein
MEKDHLSVKKNYCYKPIHRYIFKKMFVVFSLICFCHYSLFSYQTQEVKAQYEYYFTEADNLRKNGEFEKSITLLEELLQAARKNSDDKKKCEIFLRLGLLYWNLGNLDQSSNYYRQELFTAEKTGLKSKYDKAQTAVSIYNHYADGKKHRSSGQYQESINSFQDAIDLARKIGSREHEVKCLRQLSATYWQLNDLQQFFRLNEEALKIAKELNHRKEESRCLINIGVHYVKKDNYTHALN